MLSVNDELPEVARLSASETEPGSWPTQDWLGSWPTEDWVGTDCLTIWKLPDLGKPKSPMLGSGSGFVVSELLREVLKTGGISVGAPAKISGLVDDPLWSPDTSEPSSPRSGTECHTIQGLPEPVEPNSPMLDSGSEYVVDELMLESMNEDGGPAKKRKLETDPLCFSDPIQGLPEPVDPNSPMLDSGSEYIDELMLESMNEDDISDGGPAKKRKLETDPLCFYDPSEPRGGTAGVIDSKEDADEDEEMLKHRKILNFSVELAKCNFFQNIPSSKEILNSMKDAVDALPDDPHLLNDLKMDFKNPTFHIHSLYPSSEQIITLMKDKVDDLCDEPHDWIFRKLDLKNYIFHIHCLYEAVKRLYENFPYILGDEKVEEVKKMVHMKSPPFHLLYDCELKDAVETHKELLHRTQPFFHPLLRKSYKDEFFAIVDAAAEIEERKFVKGHWRSIYFSVNKHLLLQLSRAKGLRDEKYIYCCNQIKLQECLDFDLCYRKNCKNIDDLLLSELNRLPFEHDRIVKNFIETIVPKEYKDALHPDLIRLSVEVFIKSYSQEKQLKQAYMQLQSLEDAHRRKETCDVDKMLIDLHSEFPCINDFPKEGFLVTDPLEKRFCKVVDQMKEMWFSGIADHYVVEVTLLYIKRLLSETMPEASWPTDYLQKRTFYKIRPDDICHKHWMYQHVLDVEFSMP